MVDSKKYENALMKGYCLQGGAREYVIEDILGRGGFGITYKVKAKLHVNNIAIDVFFAVKEYFPDICWRDENDNSTLVAPKTKKKEVYEGLKDFINEGLKLQSVCHLNHNIVSVNEVFEANATAYYVLEYLEGGDLRQRLKDNGRPLSERQMLDVMLPIGHAVQCLHDNNILHLDIKPSNIVMRKNNDGGENEPVLIDFGIAVHFNSVGTPTSKTPSLGISAGYSPIEQYSELKMFDPRLDVYAFAATCFYLLTGKIPIEALNMPGGYVRSSLPAEVSQHVINAIAHAMSKEKDYRTPSISQLLMELTTIPEPTVPIVQNNVMPPVPPVGVGNMPPANVGNLPPVGVENMPPAPASTPAPAPASNAQEPPTQRALENGDAAITGDVPESEDKSKGNHKKSIIAIIVAFIFAAALAAGIIFLVKGCSKEVEYANEVVDDLAKEAKKDNNRDEESEIPDDPIKGAEKLIEEQIIIMKTVPPTIQGSPEEIKSYKDQLIAVYNKYESSYSGDKHDKFKSKYKKLKKSNNYKNIERAANNLIKDAGRRYNENERRAKKNEDIIQPDQKDSKAQQDKKLNVINDQNKPPQPPQPPQPPNNDNNHNRSKSPDNPSGLRNQKNIRNNG